MATTLADPATLRELVLANRILAQHGVVDAFGHVSVRDPTEPGHYLISRSLGPERVTEADLQRFTLDGQQVGGHPAAPYAERAIHGAIYAARPDVRAVFHMAGLLGTSVPVWDAQDEFGDTDMLVRSLEQGASLARTLGARRVALMRGHGSVVAGAALREVVITAVYMEVNARLQMQALGLGEVRYLTDGEIERTAGWWSSPLAIERAWNTWAARTGLADVGS